VPINNNKLARLAAERRERNKNKNIVVEQLTVEERLTRLEEDIRRLKIEYDVYFNGGIKRPPYDTKLRVESQLKRLGVRSTLRSAFTTTRSPLATLLFAKFGVAQ